MADRAYDVIVAGAGIVGAAIAYELARDGRSVLVLDAGFPGGGTTAGGMGHVVVMDDSPAQFALTAWSRALLAGMRDELSPACELDACGTLWIAEDDVQLDVARRRHAYYTTRGVPCELLDEHSLRAAEPELRHGLAGALHVPDDLVVYPPALARWLLRQAQEHGAHVRPFARAAAITAAPQTGVRCESGEWLAAQLIVNAAGAAAPQLSPGLDIVPRRGHLVITDRYPGFCRHQLVELGYLQSAHTLSVASVAFNVQPRPTGQVLIGSSRELVGWDAGSDRHVLARMLHRAAAFLPRLPELHAIRSWTAHRPATPDHLPYIGPWEPQPGVWIAAGHEGLGITTALGTARLTADLLAGRAPAIDAAPYTPARLLAAGATA